MNAGTILVVEDDRPLQDAVVTTLEAAGFTVLAAATAAKRSRFSARIPST